MRYEWIKYCMVSLVSCSLGCSHGPSQFASAPVEVTVCELVTKCTQFAEKRVRIKAEFISDGLEHSSLVDPGKYSQGIQPWTSEAVDRRPDVQALDAALAKGHPGTTDKQIIGTFTGVYKCNPTNDPKRQRILEIESVDNLTVTMRNPDVLKGKDRAR